MSVSKSPGRSVALGAALLASFAGGGSASASDVERAPLACAPGRFLPLADGREVVSEAALHDAHSDRLPIYFTVTAEGELLRSLAMPQSTLERERGQVRRLRWKRIPAPEAIARVSVCTRDDGLMAPLVFALDSKNRLWAQPAAADDPATWTSYGEAPTSTRLRCVDGRLVSLAPGRRLTSRALDPRDDFTPVPTDEAEALSRRLPREFGCSETSTLALPEASRSWEGLLPLMTSCSWGDTLSDGSVTLTVSYAGTRLLGYRATTLGKVPESLLGCLDRSLRSAFEHTRVLGSTSFTGTLHPPLRLSPSSVALEIDFKRGARAQATLELHRDYGQSFTVSRTTSDLAFLSNYASSDGDRTRLYLSIPGGRPEFEGHITLETNIPAQPQVRIPLRGQFAD